MSQRKANKAEATSPQLRSFTCSGHKSSLIGPSGEQASQGGWRGGGGGVGVFSIIRSHEMKRRSTPGR